MLFLVFPILTAQAQTLFPWHMADATNKTVFKIETQLPLRNAVISLPITITSGSFACIDADAPGKPLPAYHGSNNISLMLPGEIRPDKSRHVIVYRGSKEFSPVLPEQPRFTCDYAGNVLGRFWDFEDGTQGGITSWGNRPSHLGPITVKNGWLQIPVKNSDPYFIFGDMFDPPGSQRNLSIDSRLYRTLELRVRQSCQKAEWEFFVTDQNGQYKSSKFEVHGTTAQVFRFDLPHLFPDFWDGRKFRALRIDTTNNKKDILVEIDYVRLLPAPPAVTAGPVLSREAVLARTATSGADITLPETLTAGQQLAAKFKTSGTSVSSLYTWSIVTAEHGTIFPQSRGASLQLPIFTRAGECAWTIGLSDDLGKPLNPISGVLRVKPASLASYRLTPEKKYIDLLAPTANIVVQGLDAYGNSLPVSIWLPRWTLPGNTSTPFGRINGNPATVTITLQGDKPATHHIALSDIKGHGGETTVTTVAYRKDMIRLNANGYLVNPAGVLVFPTGGLYANFPHRLNTDGTISRSLDLFPCGPSPYEAGFPWSPETEIAVNDYLKHCADHGINCLRLMLRNMDIVGRVDPVQLKATLHLFDLARPYGIRFNVALMEDYTKPPYVSREIIEKIVLPHYTPEMLKGLPPHRARFIVEKDILASPALRYTDPDAIACQKDYLAELLPVLASREEVLCYEFENEMVYPPMAWCREIASFIRTIDPHTLILGNPGPHDWPEPLRWRESSCDLYSYHPYNDGNPTADHGAIIYLRSKFSMQSGLPMYTGEGGINQNRHQKNAKHVTPEQAARGTRDQIWMSLCCGANGCLYWVLMYELEAQEFARIKPALSELSINLATLKRRRPQAAIMLPPKQRDTRDTSMTIRLLNLGVDFDTVLTNEATAYSVRIDLEKQMPQDINLPATVAAPSPGFQIVTLLSDKNDQALLYMRNVAGGVKDFGAPPRPCYLRDVQNAEAAFTLQAKWKKIIALDIDTRQSRTLTPDSSGRVSLGITTHDFLIGLIR